jgi:hypothetical protein
MYHVNCRDRAQNPLTRKCVQRRDVLGFCHPEEELGGPAEVGGEFPWGCCQGEVTLAAVVLVVWMVGQTLQNFAVYGHADSFDGEYCVKAHNSSPCEAECGDKD